jgi:hypothetical protein
MLSYTDRLDRDPKWAVNEARKIFRGESMVDESLTRITQRLDELGISYVVVGGMAVFHHGLRRFTEDLDLLVRGEDLPRIHSELEGRGYLPLFTGSKNLRDTQSGVKIEFLVAGEYPGDGKPKPVAFPDPDESAQIVDGIRCISLQRLIELKLASWMTNSERPQDLADAQRLMRTLQLPRSFSDGLNPYVRGKFLEIWRPTRFGRIMAEGDETLIQMRLAGLTIEPWKDGESLIAITEDPQLAKEFDMHDQSELF